MENDPRVDYLGRTTTSDGVVFLVQPNGEGSLELVFEGQDLRRGTVERRVVQLDASGSALGSAVERAPAQAESQSAPAPQSREPSTVRSPSQASGDVVRSASTTESVLDGRSAPEDGTAPAALPVRIREATAAVERTPFVMPTPQLADDIERYLGSASVSGSTSSDAERALVRELSLELASALLQVATPSGNPQHPAGDYALRLVEAVRASGYQPFDRLLFLHAQLLDHRRDPRGAVALYDRLATQYPFSPHWDAARARAEYLRRHFLFIR